jgi:hypothetical protein
MAHDFDPGPVQEPFASLVRDYPGDDVYPADSFRVEWGPIFHRGRLDGTARLLIIGQDPAQSESIVRRILVGEAGHRTQGLMAKLGITRSYVMVNTFLYSVYGQQGGDRHKDDPGIADYRNRWIDAVFAANDIEAVITLGYLADGAWKTWQATANGAQHSPAYAHVTHPTEPESASGHDQDAFKAAIKAMLANWNRAIEALHPAVTHPDEAVDVVPFGDDFAPGERREIPECDVPPGVPAWMRSPHHWSDRIGHTALDKRRNITVTIPDGVVAPLH